MHLRLEGNGKERNRCQLSDFYQLEIQFPIYQLNESRKSRTPKTGPGPVAGRMNSSRKSAFPPSMTRWQDESWLKNGPSLNPLNPIGKIKHQLAQLLTFGLSTYWTLQLHKPIKSPFLATSMQHFSVGSIPNVPPVFMVQFPMFHHVW